MQQANCAHCGAPFATSRSDKRYCGKPCQEAANPRRCDQPGCSKPHRARGLCTTHYNQQLQPDRHRKSMTTCTVCGSSLIRASTSTRRPSCSVACRSALSGHDGSVGAYTWANDAAHRAREAGALVVQVFGREQVFDRDGWTCQCCGLVVSLDTDALDPRSATVDHVIPISIGGEHSLANAQCLCLRCNSIKQDRATVTLGS